MPLNWLTGVSHACFGLSYLLALGGELFRLWKPAAGLRMTSILAGVAGLFAHTLYLGYRQPSPAEPSAALLFLSWVLAVFAVYGTIHHNRQLWGVFVWPVVTALVFLSLVLRGQASNPGIPEWLLGDRSWGIIHGLLLLLAAVGLTVGGVAGTMYLVQASRVRSKAKPGGRFSLLSLERLEVMNRRATNMAFPLLTAGLILGGVLLGKQTKIDARASVKVVGTVILWVVCFVLLYLRYATTVSSRRFAWLSILAFLLTVICLAATHPFAVGGGS
jgi:ABC-type transport system involved in cytochrome c biogenesis permease subunit